MDHTDEFIGQTRPQEIISNLDHTKRDNAALGQWDKSSVTTENQMGDVFEKAHGQTRPQEIISNLVKQRGKGE